MMKRFFLNSTKLLLVMVAVISMPSCNDDSDDGGEVNEETVLIDDLLKNVDSSCKVTASGDGNVLDDYRKIIEDLSGSNDEEDLEELEFYKQRLAEHEAYCNHKSDSIKEANPELYQHLLDSLKSLDPANSLLAGIGQVIGNYCWATLTYPDVGADGKTRQMSTLVLFPCNPSYPFCADHVILGTHWTCTSDDERPSNFSNAKGLSYKTDNSNVMAGEYVAFSNYLVIMPDYEGYGASNNVSHPYLMREVQARQSIMSLLKGIGWFTSNKDLWSGKGLDKYSLKKNYKIVFEGYSQGGAVAAATYRYFLEHKNEAWAKNLPIIGAVCGDGPYDPFATLKYYCKTNYVDLPVAPALMLKGMCDYDPEMKAAKCTPADFCNPAFVKSGIFDAIASKKYNTDQCSEFAYKYAKEHPNEMKLLDNGGLSADQILTPATYNYFLNGKLIKGADYQKLSLLKKCLEKNSLFYNFTPPSDAHFMFFHSEGDKVVPCDNYTSVKNAWGKSKIYGVIYNGENNDKHHEVGSIFFKHFHNLMVYVIMANKWKPTEFKTDKEFK